MKKNLVIVYIENINDLYNQLINLSKIIAKRMQANKEVSELYLSECSMMKKIISSAAKYISKYENIKISAEDRKAAAVYFSSEIVNDLAYNVKI